MPHALDKQRRRTQKREAGKGCIRVAIDKGRGQRIHAAGVEIGRDQSVAGEETGKAVKGVDAADRDCGISRLPCAGGIGTKFEAQPEDGAVAKQAGKGRERRIGTDGDAAGKVQPKRVARYLPERMGRETERCPLDDDPKCHQSEQDTGPFQPPGEGLTCVYRAAPKRDCGPG